MPLFPPEFSRLVESLALIPNVGPKSAQKLALYLIDHPEEAEKIAKALLVGLKQVKRCLLCGNLSSGKLCYICADKTRQQDVICLVEQVTDLIAIEKTGQYKGVYHILGGVLAPLAGMGPDKLRVAELLKRIDKFAVKEVIIATDADTEGETTALYLAKLLKPLGLKVTRLASGLPAGGDIEFADEITLSRAFKGRHSL
jgi:recombination protein RecR